MVDSIHGELRNPSTAVAETGKFAANLRAKRQGRSVRQDAELGPIGAKSLLAGGEADLVGL